MAGATVAYRATDAYLTLKKMDKEFEGLSFFGFDHGRLKAGKVLDFTPDCHCRIVFVVGPDMRVQYLNVCPNSRVKVSFDTFAEYTILKYHLDFNPEGYPNGR